MKQNKNNQNNIYKNIFKKLSILIFILYIYILGYLTLFSPYYGRESFHRSLNLIPFKTILVFLNFSYKLQLEIIITNIFGNIAAFIPMGLLLPIIFRPINNLKRIFYIVMLSTLTIEVFQYVLGVGTTDIDDIILNTLGGIIGFGLYKIGSKPKK